MSKSRNQEGALIVAAIDFGTTFSGYAFSFRHEFDSDPLRVSSSQWTTGSRVAISLKSSTCVLFDPRRQFHSFGFDAEDKYSDLSYDGEHTGWYYFRRFKMMLYNSTDIHRTAMLKDETGNEMPAMDVFSAAIRYLSDHLIRSLNDRCYDSSLGHDDIKWVLTVPAIWSDAAKQFTREAAHKAGIPGDKLVLALEPEAASMFCKYLPVDKSKGTKNQITCFKPGSKYLVLDAGGGTVDITVHEVQMNGTLHELFKANGGPWGGTTVDREFLSFIERITGPEVWAKFVQDSTDEYMDILREFEVKKRTANPDLDSRVTFKIPIKLHEIYRDQTNGGELREAVRDMKDLSGKITFAGDKLRADPEVVKSLFKSSCTNIVDHLRGVLQDPRTRGTDTILMVGGFSESPMLRDSIEKSFPNTRVIVPNEAGLAVLKGAVIYGHNQHIIKQRISKYTYGIKMYKDFDSNRHPASRKILDGRKTRVQGAFSKLVEIGQPVSPDDHYEGISCQARNERGFTIKLFASEEKDPIFVDDPGCTAIGEVGVDCRLGESATVTLVFGGTEMEVRAVHNQKRTLTSAKFNFLD